jgi:hypothetical protein
VEVDMKKSPGEVYLSVLIQDKEKASRHNRNIMAAGIVNLYGRDSLKHVMVGSPLEKAVLAEMTNRKMIQANREYSHQAQAK